MHWPFRREVYRRGEVEFGQKERWIQALPFAVIEHNQRPNKAFDFLLSPFEVCNSVSLLNISIIDNVRTQAVAQR